MKRPCARVVVVVLLASIATVLNIPHNERHQSNRERLLIWSDPKTIVGKPSQESNRLDVSQLRIVAFGTSKTWGAGLEHPERESYVSLLSPTAVNLGLRSTPADYPSLCLHSMIGDQIFDVIILEFSPFGGVPHYDFERLAHKLRARFPQAIIIYLPIYMLLFDVGYQNKGLQEYLQSVVGMESSKSPAFEPSIRNLAESDLTFPCESYSINSYRESLQSFDGYMMEFPAFSNDVKMFVLDNAQYYASEERPWDFVHPNANGHQVISERIRNLLHDIHATRPINPQASDAASLGTWLGGEDRCISWFSKSNVTESDSIRYTNMDLVNFTPDGSDGKWALEVGRTGGTLSIDCAFPNCTVFMSYMAKGPHKDYPRVLMSLNADQHQEPAVPVLVDPNIDMFHVRQIVRLGTVALPCTITISIQPVPEDENSPDRFRITGVITTPTSD